MMREHTAEATRAVDNDRPPLARLGDIANDVCRVGGYIEDFISRFRGSEPTTGANKPEQVPCGHLGELERLTDAIHRVDCLARELQTIG